MQLGAKITVGASQRQPADEPQGCSPVVKAGGRVRENNEIDEPWIHSFLKIDLKWKKRGLKETHTQELGVGFPANPGLEESSNHCVKHKSHKQQLLAWMRIE